MSKPRDGHSPKDDRGCGTPYRRSIFYYFIDENGDVLANYSVVFQLIPSVFANAAGLAEIAEHRLALASSADPSSSS